MISAGGHVPHIQLIFCTLHNPTSVLQKYVNTSIMCVTCIIFHAVSSLVIDECGDVICIVRLIPLPFLTHDSIVAGVFLNKDHVLLCRHLTCVVFLHCQVAKRMAIFR